jgi:hypothetical protein
MANKFVEGGDYSIRHMAECQARHILRNDLYYKSTSSGNRNWSQWFAHMFGEDCKRELLDINTAKRGYRSAVSKGW